ncbi:glycosyltransferase [Halodesulfovibrio sp.]|uniref:glycosyltransferase family 2 protein n=1 Tax=Halodesulfovibrio sp. TaxID=1912772 RepID=UPI0025DD2F37|nr:glycosyltransferase [Halodesulfovibrio sp.]MCT4625436.1 glycosyltransferase [Halodesulfovibrio sp.]
MQTVYVVIPNYNGVRLLAECIHSVQSGSGYFLHIVVVDDASDDASMRILQQFLRDITVIQLPENRRFAAAANVGIEYALTHGADYIFLLNSDAQVSEGCLLQLLDFMNANLRVAACQPLLVDKYSPEYIQSAGVRCSFTGRGWDNLMGARVECCPHDTEEAQKIALAPLLRTVPSPFPIVGCTGGAVFFRAEALIRTLEFEQVFDESLGMYAEDLDLAFRFHQRYAATRLPFWCIPCAMVLHSGSESTRLLGIGWKIALTEKNAVQMILRYFPAMYVGVAICVFLGTALMMALVQTFRGQPKIALATLQGVGRGLVDGLRMFKRKRVPFSYRRFYELVDWNRILPPKRTTEERVI